MYQIKKRQTNNREEEKTKRRNAFLKERLKY